MQEGFELRHRLISVHLSVPLSTSHCPCVPKRSTNCSSQCQPSKPYEVAGINAAKVESIASSWKLRCPRGLNCGQLRGSQQTIADAALEFHFTGYSRDSNMKAHWAEFGRRAEEGQVSFQSSGMHNPFARHGLGDATPGKRGGIDKKGKLFFSLTSQNITARTKSCTMKTEERDRRNPSCCSSNRQELNQGNQLSFPDRTAAVR